MQNKSVVQIKRTENHIIIKSPYNSFFVEKARNLAGKWVALSEAWQFDIRDEAEVLEVCYFCYGEDGIRNNKCNIKITFVEAAYADKSALNVLGHTLARAFNRDSGARLSDGVLVKSGGFDSGGSMKNWTTKAKAGTVIVLRDVSKPLVQAFLESDDYEPESMTIEILEEYQDLNAEKEHLLARLAEINAQLGEA